MSNVKAQNLKQVVYKDDYQNWIDLALKELIKSDVVSNWLLFWKNSYIRADRAWQQTL